MNNFQLVFLRFFSAPIIYSPSVNDVNTLIYDKRCAVINANYYTPLFCQSIRTIGMQTCTVTLLFFLPSLFRCKFLNSKLAIFLKPIYLNFSYHYKIHMLFV